MAHASSRKHAGASRRANHGVFRHRALLFVAGIAATGLPGSQL